MSGLTVEQFDILWKCIELYSNQIIYNESAFKSRASTHVLDQQSEFLLMLTCCKHGLNLGISGLMAGIRESSMQRLFTAWIVFLASLFVCIDMSPAPGFLQMMMQKVFKLTDHHLTDHLGTVQNSSFKLPQIMT